MGGLAHNVQKPPPRKKTGKNWKSQGQIIQECQECVECQECNITGTFPGTIVA